MRKSFILMLAMLLLVASFAACSDDPPPTEPPLELEEPYETVEPEIEDEPEVEPEIENGPETEDEPEVAEFPLAGEWLWDGLLAYIYIFEEDGSGMRGFVCDGEEGFVPEIEFFEWSTTDDGSLTIEIDDGTVEQWSYVINGAVLTIRSEQLVGLEYSYIRIVTEGEDEMVGTWAWVGDSAWEYVFEANGQGTRTNVTNTGVETFEWILTADGGLILDMDGGIVEMWSYVIEDDMLTLTSRQAIGMAFSYQRVG